MSAGNATEGGRALVLGASMAGLAAAAALAGRFDRVTVLERDDLAGDARARPGVPQGSHGHVLLPSGLRTLVELLPGIAGDLEASGAVLSDATEMRFYLAEGPLRLVESGLGLVGATRPHLEGVVRRRVEALPGVEVVAGHEVEGLVASPSGDRVEGVAVRAPGSAASATMAADLVVDATGRASTSARWLTELGYPAPEEDRMHVGVHYATRLFRRRPGDLGGCSHVVVAVPPGGRRGGFAVAVEGGRWLVTVMGHLGERPPTDLEGFGAYAASLTHDDLGTLVARAEPASEAASGGFPAYRRRRYDRLARLPGGWAVVGDALCSLNPAYAMGMSTALAQAVLLGEAVERRGPERAGAAFLRASRRVLDPAWDLATGSDLAHPEMDGPRPVSWRILNAYLQRLLPRATVDPVLARAAMEVMTLVAPPPSVLRPGIAWRALRPRRRPTHPAPDPVARPSSAAHH